MKSNGLQKYKFPKCLVNWEKFGIATEATLRSPDRVTFKNLKVSLWIGNNLEVSLWVRKNLEVKSKTNTQKIPVLNLWMNWEKLCPNLSFTVENKIGNLHKTRLFARQI